MQKCFKFQNYVRYLGYNDPGVKPLIDKISAYIGIRSMPHLIVATKKKVFKNFTAFKRHNRIFRKTFLCLVFPQLSESA